MSKQVARLKNGSINLKASLKSDRFEMLKGIGVWAVGKSSHKFNPIGDATGCVLNVVMACIVGDKFLFFPNL